MIALDQSKRSKIDVADGVGSWSLLCEVASSTTNVGIGNRILTYSAIAVWRTAGALSSTLAWTSCGVGHMQLLLMPQQQISPRKASRALWTLKGLFLGVRPLVSLEMF